MPSKSRSEPARSGKPRSTKPTDGIRVGNVAPQESVLGSSAATASNAATAEPGAAHVPLAIPPASPASAIVADGDLALYRQKLPGWRKHQGEHVLIYGAKVHGFFATRDEALQAGFDRFGDVAFLVKQVDLDAKPRPLVGIIL
jgi:hypothetical protein